MSELPQHEPQWVDTAISRLLRTGVLAAMAVILIGLVATFIHHPQYVHSRSALGPLTDATILYPHTYHEIAEQLRAGRGQALVILGLLMLVATPVARVAFSIIVFAIERDRLYLTITSLVLALLGLSFVLGAAW
jgi:uncharacterized membrane protein